MRNPGFHLFLPTFSFHWDSLVTVVLALRAQHAHTPLVSPAVQLQEPLVLLTYSLLQHRHGFNQLVDLHGCDSQVWLQVTLAI